MRYVSLAIALPFGPVSGMARETSYLFIWVVALCLVILGVVVFFTARNVIKFRDKGQGTPPQTFGNNKLEIMWTAIPLVAVTVVYIFTVLVMHWTDPSVAHPHPDLEVIGHQWWWEVHYPKTGVVTANEIYIPTHKRLLIEVRSTDVIHSFWVPQLGRKMNCIPGHPNYFWIKSDKTGTFQGTCSLYCGSEHAWMRLIVYAVPLAKFNQWQRSQLISQASVASLHPHGAKEFFSHTCISCHAVRGTIAHADYAPNLSDIGARPWLGAGVMKNTLHNMKLWIFDPQKYKPDCYMPDLHLKHRQADAIARYLEALK